MVQKTITGHTPGPWKFSGGRSKTDESAVITGKDGTWVAAAYDFNRYDRDAEVEANARLIAAAPDLLAACEALWPLMEEQMEPSDEPPPPDVASAYALLRDAIARASGAD